MHTAGTRVWDPFLTDQDRAHRVIVVEECVFDRHQTAHAMNLFDMHQKYADVLPLADVDDRRWRSRHSRNPNRFDGLR